MMRDGRITSVFERGEGDDAGRYRVTFQDGAHRVRLIVDVSGRVLQRTRTPVAGGGTRREANIQAAGDPSGDIVETGNGSWRFKNRA
jgi:hypothetical protein